MNYGLNHRPIRPMIKIIMNEEGPNENWMEEGKNQVEWERKKLIMSKIWHDHEYKVWQTKRWHCCWNEWYQLFSFRSSRSLIFISFNVFFCVFSQVHCSYCYCWPNSGIWMGFDMWEQKHMHAALEWTTMFFSFSECKFQFYWTFRQFAFKKCATESHSKFGNLKDPDDLVFS